MPLESLQLGRSGPGRRRRWSWHRLFAPCSKAPSNAWCITGHTRRTKSCAISGASAWSPRRIAGRWSASRKNAVDLTNGDFDWRGYIAARDVPGCTGRGLELAPATTRFPAGPDSRPRASERRRLSFRGSNFHSGPDFLRDDRHLTRNRPSLCDVGRLWCDFALFWAKLPKSANSTTFRLILAKSGWISTKSGRAWPVFWHLTDQFVGKFGQSLFWRPSSWPHPRSDTANMCPCPLGPTPGQTQPRFSRFRSDLTMTSAQVCNRSSVS